MFHLLRIPEKNRTRKLIFLNAALFLICQKFYNLVFPNVKILDLLHLF